MKSSGFQQNYYNLLLHFLLQNIYIGYTNILLQNKAKHS